MEYLFLGLIIGIVVAYFVLSRFSLLRKKEKVSTQSMVLMENIRSVSKLITVEADFAEIYHYKANEYKWLELLLGPKKALLLIDAKALVGFDLTKIKMNPDLKNKTIIISNFPQPELLSVETDFKYYDKQEGWLNPFTSSDLTEITRDAKQHIIDKIPSSGILEEASSKALETIQLMEKIAETINWKLDYSSLLLSEEKTKKQLSEGYKN